MLRVSPQTRACIQEETQ